MEGRRSAVRLLQLYLLLCDGKRYTLSQLAERINGSRQTVLRLMEELDCVRGVVIKKWKEGRQRYYQLRSRTSMSSIPLDPDTIRYLVLCQHIVRHMIPEPVRENLEHRFMEHLAGGESPASEGESFSLETLKKGYVDYTPFRGIFDDLELSMRKRTLCRVIYRTRINKPEKIFYIAPLKLLATKDSFYVVGQVTDQNGNPEDRSPMTMALHRIRSVTRLEKRFPDTWRQRADAVGLHNFGFRFDPPFRVRIRFNPDAATYVHERRWSEDEEKRLLEDGSLELVFTSTSRPEVRAFVCGFGSGAELLEPEDLRKEIMDDLEQAARQYRRI
ncbi:MAG TPA: WYL domain-containing protein [Candidatus Hydrogenedentes bacterium]|nr:WYL domain-containing protein [Candidatus Hydrogenedentota bacterium]